jgi:hypothetical protein
MNELQIRLTADIKDLQSALAKAKQTLKSFETETATDSEKSNVGFRRKIGLIEQLTAKAKQLKVSLSQATNEQQIASFNAELEQTNIELTRLNALGKTFANSSTQSFNKFRVSAGAAGGSAIAFNRIIQDAPFGIIGVGNNIQQFAEQLGALRTTTGSTGAALSTFFRSLFTGSNLVILGVSAITAALTAYQLGAFDSAEETKDLAKELEDYKNTLDGVSRGQIDGAQSAQKQIQAFQLLRLQAENLGLSDEKRLLAVKKLKAEFPDLLKGYTDEEILLGKVGKAYQEITKQLSAYATAQSLSSIAAENNSKAVVLQFQEQKRALEVLKERALLEKATAGFNQTSGLKVAGQFTASNIEATRIQERITELELEQVESANTRQELAKENLFINEKISEAIGNAGGLIDKNTESVKSINRELNYYELIQDRVNQKIDVEKKTLEDLAQTQRNLFREVRELRQEPINFVNAANLVLAEQKLKAIDEIIGPLESKFKEVQIEIDPTKLEGLELPTTKEIQDPGIIEGLQKQIESFEKLKQVTSDPTMLALYTLQIGLLKNQLAEFNGEEVKSNLQLIADAFGSMGQQIANSLNISNRSLRGFVTTLVSATPKIVAAIQAKAQATDSAADKETIANAKLAAGNSVVVATEGAKALGPVGLALLPVFIAGALALVSSAFGKAGGGGGSVSAGQGSTFTNRREFGGPVSKGRAYIVGEKRPELFVPNTNGIIIPQLPSMDYSGASMAAGAMAVDVNIRGVSYGDDILFTVQQAQIRRGIR